MTNSNIISMLLTSSVFGTIFTGFLYVLLSFIITKSTKFGTDVFTSRENFTSGFLTGILERIFFSFLFYSVGGNGFAPAAIAWIAIKGQVHYKIFSDSNDLPRVYLAILGSIISLSFATLGGLCLQQEAISQAILSIPTIIPLMGVSITSLLATFICVFSDKFIKKETDNITEYKIEKTISEYEFIEKNTEKCELIEKLRQELIEKSRQAALMSYSKYSKFRVGSSVLVDGIIYTGSNIENGSYSLTICAERSAIFTAMNNGAKKIDAISISCIDAKTDKNENSELMPCGACLQLMSEFGQPDMPVIVDGVRTFKLKELLPFPFKLR